MGVSSNGGLPKGRLPSKSRFFGGCLKRVNFGKKLQFAFLHIIDFQLFNFLNFFKISHFLDFLDILRKNILLF
jgi:hypothetical protein